MIGRGGECECGKSVEGRPGFSKRLESSVSTCRRERLKGRDNDLAGALTHYKPPAAHHEAGVERRSEALLGDRRGPDRGVCDGRGGEGDRANVDRGNSQGVMKIRWFNSVGESSVLSDLCRGLRSYRVNFHGEAARSGAPAILSRVAFIGLEATLSITMPDW